MGLNIVMLFSVFIVLVIMYFAMRFSITNEATFLFGARVNDKMRHSDEYKEFVDKVKKDFHRNMNWIAILAIFISLCPLLISSISIRTFIWTLWIFGIIVIMSIPQANAFKKVVKWKADNGYIDDNDDDKYWKWGVIYNNPNDKHTMVEKRIGIGTTVNVASIGGKVTNWIIVIVIVGTFLMLGWIVLDEFLPIHLVVDEQTVMAKQIGVEYKVEIEDIDEISLLNDIPRMSRSSGTDMEKLCKGNFYVPEEHHDCKVLFNPQNKLLIRIKSGKDIYFFGGYDDEETMSIYNELKDEK